MSWAPLPKIICGRAIKPFTPLDDPSILSNRHVSQHLKNIYSGDLLYVFETCSSPTASSQTPATTTSNKWGRGYLVSQLDPADFSLASVSIDVLLETKSSVIIFPLSHMQVLRELQITSTDDQLDSLSSENGLNIYSNDASNDVYSLGSSNVTTGSSGGPAKRRTRPALPTNDYALSIDSLLGEIEASLKSLNVHIFALYTRGDMTHFKKMVQLFNELEEIKFNFKYGLLTREEVKEAKKKTAYQLTKISKIVASETGQKSKKDVAAYESILARDEITGELFAIAQDDYANKLKDLARLAQNQIFGALSPYYPVSNSDIRTYPERNKQFEQCFPSHILVDFKSLSGESHKNPKGYCGLTAYIYLCNSKKRLTECFAIELGPDNDLLIDGLSAALFKNIPANEIDSGRIYLVALITETVQLKPSSSSNGVPNLQTIRKGMCAGAVDISRIFTRRKDHLDAQKSHEFCMKLYASFMAEDSSANAPFQLYPGMNPLLAMSMTMANNGWGELVDRIISGSNKGIAINPRCEKLDFTIKELKNESFVSEIQTNRAIDVIRTLFFDPAEPNYDRIYLKVIKASDLAGIDDYLGVNDSKFVTVHVRASSKNLKFSKGSNEHLADGWSFVSTSPDEHVGEVVQITGLPRLPTNENEYFIQQDHRY
ncbi:unnamed protein product [Ambrosiozyma monospora]|uniref:Unnamed protein product n=1 Tax=Ambrosiozyma monospora TaxID=43982 RepID=A0ACB5T5V3_AMBMO|nr:unnamed protein product [Ambrosiozyma monospora]